MKQPSHSGTIFPDAPSSSASEAVANWLIRKNGHFYRPNKAGYTSRKSEAGRYTEADAKSEARIEKGMQAIHVDDWPDDAAPVDEIREMARAQASYIERLRAENERLTRKVEEHRAAKDRARDLLDQSVRQTSDANSRVIAADADRSAARTALGLTTKRAEAAEGACKAAWDSILRYPGSVHDRAMSRLERVLHGRNVDFIDPDLKAAEARAASAEANVELLVKRVQSADAYIIEQLTRAASAEAERDALAAKLAVMDAALTPSAATKAAYIGEFHFDWTVWDPTGEEQITHRVPVPWTTIKEIMAAISRRAREARASEEEKG